MSIQHLHAFRKLRALELLFLVLLFLALFAALPAQAQTPPEVVAEADLSWTLPTTDTLGAPLTGENALQKVQVYASTSPIGNDTTLPPIELPAAAQTFEYTGSVANGSTLYFRVRACNAVCSALSSEATKEVRVSVPNVPTGVTVTVRVRLGVQ